MTPSGLSSASSTSAPASALLPHSPLPLPREFYDRDTLQVARDLLGCQLVRLHQGKLMIAQIVETEAYRGSEDSACHAHRRKTPRTEAMFGPPGHAYVYLVYGMHWLLNVVTQPEGNPCAVLIRAVEPVEGEDAMRALRSAKGRQLCNGPGKLTRALSVDKALYGHDMTRSEQLWITQAAAPAAIASGPRVGIDYAQPADRDAPWRLWHEGNPWVSKAR
ncbi:MAG: DNA-3-methyladenine glycosylase [Pseudomonadota bacterium]